jgi:hypothetical protein
MSEHELPQSNQRTPSLRFAICPNQSGRLGWTPDAADQLIGGAAQWPLADNGADSHGAPVQLCFCTRTEIETASKLSALRGISGIDFVAWHVGNDPVQGPIKVHRCGVKVNSFPSDLAIFALWRVHA